MGVIQTDATVLSDILMRNENMLVLFDQNTSRSFQRIQRSLMKRMNSRQAFPVQYTEKQFECFFLFFVY